MKDSELNFTAGLTKIQVEADAEAMGRATAAFVAEAMKAAVARGERPVLWLMAAPSGFAFYGAFVELAGSDPALAAICREAAWFQFDDYPVPRGDKRFPITFRHLLETRFFDPLRQACGTLKDISLLEIGGADDERVCGDYGHRLIKAAENPKNCLIQLKGIGMDGHWGFHGHETPLDAPPAVIKVPMNEANIHQQKLDWPEYFRNSGDVPRYACTCDVQLFLKARIIVDNVPQASKAYSVLAAYGNDKILGDIPSSALKAHPGSHAFLTMDSAEALLEYRKALARDKSAKLSPSLVSRLESVWSSDDKISQADNIAAMKTVLSKLGML
jgi:6-phosphogluconolactonase/glucosamine-6-phosphate isomerase/deaminase